MTQRYDDSTYGQQGLQDDIAGRQQSGLGGIDGRQGGRGDLGSFGNQGTATSGGFAGDRDGGLAGGPGFDNASGAPTGHHHHHGHHHGAGAGAAQGNLANQGGFNDGGLSQGAVGNDFNDSQGGIGRTSNLDRDTNVGGLGQQGDYSQGGLSGNRGNDFAAGGGNVGRSDLGGDNFSSSGAGRGNDFSRGGQSGLGSGRDGLDQTDDFSRANRQGAGSDFTGGNARGAGTDFSGQPDTTGYGNSTNTSGGSMGDKLKGGLDKLVGKATKDPERYERGVERAQGGAQGQASDY